MIRIETISPTLELRENGIWYSKGTKDISYPEDGNERCFEIEERSFWFRHRNNCIITAVKQYPPEKNQPIFDIGGGNGYVSRGLEQAGFETVVVEPGQNGAHNAKKRGLHNVVCSTFEQAGFKPGTIGAAGLFDTIEHLPEDRKFLSSIYEILQEKGTIYLTVPSYQILWSADDNLAGHFRRYSLAQVCRTVESAGFRIVFSSYFFRYLPVGIFLFRTIPYCLRLTRKKTSEKKITREHCLSEGISAKIVKQILKKETDLLAEQKPIKWGGSCLVVAQKD